MTDYFAMIGFTEKEAEEIMDYLNRNKIMELRPTVTQEPSEWRN